MAGILDSLNETVAQRTSLMDALDSGQRFDPASIQQIDQRAVYNEGEFMKGLRRFGYSALATTEAFTGQMAEPFAPQFAKNRIAGALDTMQRMPQGLRPRVEKFADVNNVGDFRDWAASSLGEGLPSTALMAGGALAGGGLGALATRSAAGLRGGALAGGVLPMTAMEGGETALQLQQDPRALANTTPAERAALTLGRGVLNAGLETAVPAALVLPRLMGKATRIGPGFGNAVRNTGLVAGAGALGEYATEGTQDLTGQAALKYARGEPLTSGYDWAAANEAGLAGALTGFALGGAGGVAQGVYSNLGAAKDAGVDLAQKGLSKIPGLDKLREKLPSMPTLDDVVGTMRSASQDPRAFGEAIANTTLDKLADTPEFLDTMRQYGVQGLNKGADAVAALKNNLDVEVGSRIKDPELAKWYAEATSKLGNFTFKEYRDLRDALAAKNQTEAVQSLKLAGVRAYEGGRTAFGFLKDFAGGVSDAVKSRYGKQSLDIRGGTIAERANVYKSIKNLNEGLHSRIINDVIPQIAKDLKIPINQAKNKLADILNAMAFNPTYLTATGGKTDSEATDLPPSRRPSTFRRQLGDPARESLRKELLKDWENATGTDLKLIARAVRDGKNAVEYKQLVSNPIANFALDNGMAWDKRDVLADAAKVEKYADLSPQQQADFAAAAGTQNPQTLHQELVQRVNSTLKAREDMDPSSSRNITAPPMSRADEDGNIFMLDTQESEDGTTYVDGERMSVDKPVRSPWDNKAINVSLAEERFASDSRFTVPIYLTAKDAKGKKIASKVLARAFRRRIGEYNPKTKDKDYTYEPLTDVDNESELMLKLNPMSVAAVIQSEEFRGQFKDSLDEFDKTISGDARSARRFLAAMTELELNGIDIDPQEIGKRGDTPIHIEVSVPTDAFHDELVIRNGDKPYTLKDFRKGVGRYSSPVPVEALEAHYDRLKKFRSAAGVAKNATYELNQEKKKGGAEAALAKKLMGIAYARAKAELDKYNEANPPKGKDAREDMRTQPTFQEQGVALANYFEELPRKIFDSKSYGQVGALRNALVDEAIKPEDVQAVIDQYRGDETSRDVADILDVADADKLEVSDKEWRDDHADRLENMLENAVKGNEDFEMTKLARGELSVNALKEEFEAFKLTLMAKVNMEGGKGRRAPMTPEKLSSWANDLMKRISEGTPYTLRGPNGNYGYFSSVQKAEAARQEYIATLPESASSYEVRYGMLPGDNSAPRVYVFNTESGKPVYDPLMGLATNFVYQKNDAEQAKYVEMLRRRLEKFPTKETASKIKVVDTRPVLSFYEKGGDPTKTPKTVNGVIQPETVERPGAQRVRVKTLKQLKEFFDSILEQLNRDKPIPQEVSDQIKSMFDAARENAENGRKPDTGSRKARMAGGAGKPKQELVFSTITDDFGNEVRGTDMRVAKRQLDDFGNPLVEPKKPIKDDKEALAQLGSIGEEERLRRMAAQAAEKRGEGRAAVEKLKAAYQARVTANDVRLAKVAELEKTILQAFKDAPTAIRMRELGARVKAREADLTESALDRIRAAYNERIKELTPAAQPKTETGRKFADLPAYKPGQRTMRYAGVGSRETPPEVLEKMTAAAKALADMGYTLQSGGAAGADTAFEKGAGNKKQIFYAKDATPETIDIAKEIHPNPAALKKFPLDLMARNTFQVFGANLDAPVDFLLAWTKDGAEASADRSRTTGGTGQAIDMASRKGVPVINMAKPDWPQRLRAIVDAAKKPAALAKAGSLSKSDIEFLRGALDPYNYDPGFDYNSLVGAKLKIEGVNNGVVDFVLITEDTKTIVKAEYDAKEDDFRRIKDVLRLKEPPAAPTPRGKQSLDKGTPNKSREDIERRLKEIAVTGHMDTAALQDAIDAEGIFSDAEKPQAAELLQQLKDIQTGKNDKGGLAQKTVDSWSRRFAGGTSVKVVEIDAASNIAKTLATRHATEIDKIGGIAMQIDGGYFVVTIKGGAANKATSLSRLAHEFGHILQKIAFNNAPQSVKDKLLAAHKADLAAFEKDPKNIRSFISAARIFDDAVAGEVETGLARIPTEARKRLGADIIDSVSAGVGEGVKNGSEQQRDYLLSFEEWFAEQFSKFVTSGGKTLDPEIQSLWQKLYADLKNFFNAIVRQLTPNAEFKSWVESIATPTGGKGKGATPGEGKKSKRPKKVVDAENITAENIAEQFDEQIEQALTDSQKKFTDIVRKLVGNRVKISFANLPGSKAASTFMSRDDALKYTQDLRRQYIDQNEREKQAKVEAVIERIRKDTATLGYIIVTPGREAQAGLAEHESFHGAFEFLFNQEERRTIATAFSKGLVYKKLRELFKDQPEVLEQMEKDPEEAAAYGFQIWMTDPKALPLGEKTKNLFTRLKEFFMKLIGAQTIDEKALMIMKDLRDGTRAEKGTSPAARVLDKDKPWTERAQKHVRAAGNAAKQLYDGVLTSVYERLDDLDNPAISKIIRAGYQPTGTEGKAGMIQNMRAKDIELRNRISEHFAGISEEMKKELHEALVLGSQGGDGLTDAQRASKPELVSMIARTRALYQELYEYLKDAGVEMNYAGKNYYPLVFDSELVNEKRDEFIKMMRQDKYKEKLANLHVTPEEAWDNITAYLDRGENLTSIFSSEREPEAASTKTRTFAFLDAADRLPFMKADPVYTTVHYAKEAVRHAEYVRVYGNKSAKLQELKDEARLRYGATASDIALVNDYIDGLMGNKAVDMSRELKDLYGAVTVYQNYRLLPFSLFNSLVDPVGIAVRSNSIGDAWSAFSYSIKNTFRRFKKDYTPDEWEKIAADWGIIEAEGTTIAADSLYTGVTLRGKTKELNDALFKYNGLDGWVRNNTAMAVKAAQRFFYRAAQGDVFGAERSARYLEEVGLSKDDVIFDEKAGRILMRKEELMAAGKSETEAAAIEARLKAATQTFVRQALLVPTSAELPNWASNPYLAPIAHLKQFVWAFNATITNRILHELNYGNYTPALMAVAYVPGMIAATFIKDMVSGFGDEPPYKKNWGVTDYVLDGVNRSGLTGTGQFFASAKEDIVRGGTGLEFLAGPTANQINQGVKALASGDGDNLWNFAVRSGPLMPIYDQALLSKPGQ